MAVKLFHKFYSCPSSSEYVIIVHGLFGMLDNWHNIASKLSKTINVISVDCRNHGKSPHVDEMSYSLMASDLEQLVQDLNIKKATFIGHSMGGKVVMQLAADTPNIIDKMIVVDIAPKDYKPGHHAYFEAYKNIPFGSFSSRKDADEAFQAYETNIGIRQFLLKNLERDAHGFKLKINVAAIEAFYNELISKISLKSNNDINALIISGGRSGYVSQEDYAVMEELYPGIKWVKIEDAGHWVHAEKPNEFVDAVLDFIA